MTESGPGRRRRDVVGSSDPHVKFGSGPIVVGVDGSPNGEDACRWAVGQARLTGQPVEAVIAWDIPANFSLGALSELDWEAAATRALNDSLAVAVDPADAELVSRRTVKGHPAQVLLEAAADAALLVVGSRGRGGFTGMLLGSVSQQVIARAACPVVVVRASADPPP